MPWNQQDIPTFKRPSPVSLSRKSEIPLIDKGSRSKVSHTVIARRRCKPDGDVSQTVNWNIKL